MSKNTRLAALLAIYTVCQAAICLATGVIWARHGWTTGLLTLLTLNTAVSAVDYAIRGRKGKRSEANLTGRCVALTGLALGLAASISLSAFFHLLAFTVMVWFAALCGVLAVVIAEHRAARARATSLSRRSRHPAIPTLPHDHHATPILSVHEHRLIARSFPGIRAAMAARSIRAAKSPVLALAA